MAAMKKETVKKEAPEKEMVSIPEGLKGTFKTVTERKGAYLFSDGVWFFTEKQASKYERKNKEVTRKYVANPYCE